MSDRVITFTERGITADQADRISALKDDLGLTWDDLDETAAQISGGYGWLELNRQDARALIAALLLAKKVMGR